MQNFDYITPTRLIFGRDVIEKLPEVMSQFGKKILLTYGGGSIKKIGLYDKVSRIFLPYCAMTSGSFSITSLPKISLVGVM